tara:strand:+ start:1961 stop:2128 length:168 start_codon:yes stop_codon:yes gene_type:complete
MGRFGCSTVLFFDTLVHLATVNGHFGGRIDTQPDLFALHIQDSDPHVVPDDDALA